GSAPTSCENGRSGGPTHHASPSVGPEMTSSIAAASATVRVIGPFVDSWLAGRDGPATRPRLGLMPNRPHADDGIRIDPPPSLPCEIGHIPEASAAAAPPEDPPGVRSVSHGLRVGPNAFGSVHGPLPNSGVLVLPRTMNPARFSAATTSSS